MTEFHKALMTFRQQFGIPVFLAGCVDDQTAFPYITVEIADGDLLGETVLTATSWHRRGDVESWTPVMTERAALMDAVQTAIPQRQMFLGFPGGYVTIRRNDVDFITYVTDDEDPRVIGGRVAYIIKFFHL